MSVIPALRRLRQEDNEFETSLGYKVKALFQKERSGVRGRGRERRKRRRRRRRKRKRKRKRS
jgi:hypothetical protein